MNIFELVKSYSTTITNNRTIGDVALSAQSEMGELAEEVLIASGRSYKQSGDDGIIGESVDVIITILDLLNVHYPDLTEEQLNSIALLKLEKWKRCVSK